MCGCFRTRLASRLRGGGAFVIAHDGSPLDSHGVGPTTHSAPKRRERGSVLVGPGPERRPGVAPSTYTRGAAHWLTASRSSSLRCVRRSAGAAVSPHRSFALSLPVSVSQWLTCTSTCCTCRIESHVWSVCPPHVHLLHPDDGRLVGRMLGARLDHDPARHQLGPLSCVRPVATGVQGEGR